MIIVDSHTHVMNAGGDFAPLFAMAERLHYSGLAVQSLQCGGRLLQNLACALLKVTFPGTTYAFGGLDYVMGVPFAAQAKALREMGFDGIKMLEGKPTTRAMLKKALNDPEYDDFFDYLEETGFPVLLHVADPPEFWDRDKVPDWALAQGWFYDETHVHYDQYYEEVEEMLNKHPKLRAIFAHFYFLSGEPERAQKFLDDHPLVSIDVTAGVEMYENFSKDPAFWRAFFIKNRDRIIFGTDSTEAADLPGDDATDGKVNLDGYAAMEIEFLRHDKEVEIFGKKFHGLGLPEETQRRIFAENFQAYAGKAPKPMDIGALLKEADRVRSFLTEEEDKLTLNRFVAQLEAVDQA